MRVVSLHLDVLVATSAIWQTNCVVVRGAGTGGAGSVGAEAETGGDGVADGSGDVTDGSAVTRDDPVGETFVIDSPILPDELDALPALIEQAGFPDAERAAGHARGLGSPARAARLPGPGARLRREHRRAAAGLAGRRPARAARVRRAASMIERPRPLMLGQVQALPVPGRCGIGELELELHPADGHTADGMAVWIPWARVLVAGDYLSPVESPEVARAARSRPICATLERLRPLVALAEQSFPVTARC